MPDDIQVGTQTDAHTPDSVAAPAGDTPEAPAKKAAKKAPAKKATAKKAAVKKTATKKAVAKKAAAPPDAELPLGTGEADTPAADTPAADAPAVDAPVAKKAAAKKAPAKKTAAKKTTARKTTAKKAATPPHGDALAEAPAAAPEAPEAPAESGESGGSGTALLFQAPEAKPPARRTRKTAQARPATETPAEAEAPAETAEAEAETEAGAEARPAKTTAKKTAKKGGGRKPQAEPEQPAEAAATETPESAETGDSDAGEAEGDETEGEGGGRRRRRRGGRRRRKAGDGGGDQNGQADGESAEGEAEEAATSGEESGGEGTSRRRRRRRRSGEDGGEGGDDPDNTVTRVRRQRSAEDEITAVSGSTRLEAKKQRRREGREAGRRRAPIVSEAEFLARREAVDRVMVIRQRDELTQIGVLEDKVLVEHYVARESQTSLIGNVYLGRVQNVLPSMEAAFIDIGKGRNAVLYAGEVNWSALGHRDGQQRKIESVLSSGQPVLVQVTKDPIGHKGARLTSQISLAGRFLVYVPDGTTSGISRKLPDTERNRLKTLLKEIVPDSAGVIVRTAAEGASEEELTRDVERLKARWEDIEKKAKGSAPQLLYGEPDLTLKVVRDLFTEDFAKLVIQGDEAWETVQSYVEHVAPDLQDRLQRFEVGANGKDVFASYRIDEQIAKGLDRKVWLPSGGSLIIDRTEAMTVVDVNTGKFTGSGGNLEETVTKNNLEAAEEIVRQLRLRDIGGIIVVDFIDMVLESNRDLVLRRLVECLGRDRTRHQVAEVTSLGLVQMTRKRIGTGLLEAFSENCEHCQGRGVVIHEAPIEPKRSDDDSRRGGRRGRGGKGRGQDQEQAGGANGGGNGQKAPSPIAVAAMARPENADKAVADEPETTADAVPAPPVELEDTPERPAVDGVAPAGASVAAEEPAVVEPPAPKVVTRTRRRSASRPAGEPASAAAAEITLAPAAEPTPASEPEPEAEPASDLPAAPEPPKVVTRTRRRSASRPAGPPAQEPDERAADLPPAVGSLGSVGTPPVSGTVEPGTADAEPGADAHPVEHVPVKKKGSRKR